jgi:hypothetical protein
LLIEAVKGEEEAGYIEWRGAANFWAIKTSAKRRS